MLNKKALAASVSAPPKVFVEDVFSTYLYTGTGATQTITNDIDLSGKGGLTWIKGRSGATGHRFTDTVRGATKSLASNSTDAEATESTGLTAFSSTGFTIGADADYNTSAATYCSWTFREQPKFFDIVTYTGNGSTSGQQINHNLGSAPGMLIVKDLNNAGDWGVYQKDLGRSKWLYLNKTDSVGTYTNVWGTSDPTSTTFTASYALSYNESGVQYVAYLFAHDAGGFGTAGTDNVISCGTYTTNSSGAATVNLGYEPQFILTKGTAGTGGATDWQIGDIMRGMPAPGANINGLFPNTSGAEDTAVDRCANPTSTGFEAQNQYSTTTYIYMAIRRPMKVPTTGTSVFSPNYQNVSTGTAITTNFPPDLQLYRSTAQVANEGVVVDRLRGVNTTTTANSTPWLDTTTTAAEATASSVTRNWGNTGFEMPGFVATIPSVFYSFSRRPGFMDVVCYTGTGSATTFNHNLGVVPELMIVKMRSSTNPWRVYSAPTLATTHLALNTDAATTTSSANWNDTAPTSSVFTVGTGTGVNGSGGTYVNYLFATCAGVSKVGSYTGTAAAQTINCGFTGGARFVLIKRTDSTGDWYVWDTARGIISGNDPYLLLNSTAAEVTNTDYIDPVSSGFELSSTAPAAINASGGTFIFLAVS